MKRLAPLHAGDRFDRWTVLEQATDGRHATYLCRCDCGTVKAVRERGLRYGGSRSCGCLMLETARFGPKHGTHRQSTSPTYKSWASMKDRCTNPRNRNFYRYGGRGINICEKWLGGFEAFLDDMGERPAGSSIDRIDNNGSYEPGNCRWATHKQQQNNRRDTVLIELDGERRSLVEWCEHFGVPYTAVRSRRWRGISGAALFEPVISFSEASNRRWSAVRKAAEGRAR